MIKNIRIIARLDIKGANLIKSINLEGLRIIGDPQEHAARYYEEGADELLYIDTVASLYGRNNLVDIVEKTAENIFIPITVGGGIRSVEDARKILRSGADKIALNTAAVNNPLLISDIAQVFGSQSLVVSIEAKKIAEQKWIVHTHNGREKTPYDVIEWSQQAVALGAGEILLTSIDQEGTGLGFDYELVRLVNAAVSVPIIASGGMGDPYHLSRVIEEGADAIAIANVLHYKKMSLKEVKAAAKNTGQRIRDSL